MNVAVLGYGVEGKSAERYWRGRGHQVTIRDIKDGPNYLEGLDQYEGIVRSPSVKPQDILAANPGLDRTKITSVTTEFFEQCPAKIIGVTGTKGKGTTATLITKMLAVAGHRAHLAGNIGTPALDLLAEIQPDDWVVLELSSFQLIDVRHSPHVGVMLMIAPDHQDWHMDMDEYLTAKQNIFAHQEQGDRAVFNACNVYSLQSGLGAPGDQLPYNDPTGAWTDGESVMMESTVICTTSDIALMGRHNWDNVCAAIGATWPIVQDAAPIRSAIREFTGLEHRLERVGEIKGTTYINDSYAANPEPTVAAINAFTEPKVLIVGGHDRGQSFGRLAEAIRTSTIRSVIVLGEVAPKITAALQVVDYTDFQLAPADITEVVKLAASTAQPGDVVLFSPGCPSFDMFKNFQERGEAFKRAVTQLKKAS